MKKNAKSIFLSYILFPLLLNACQVSSVTPSPGIQSTLPSEQGSDTYIPIFSITPSPINDLPDEPSNGPWLLIKDDTNPNQSLVLLDISTKKIKPISIPTDLTFSNLPKSLSPNTNKLILSNTPSDPLANQALYIFDYLNGEIEVDLPLSLLDVVDFSKIYTALPDEMKDLMNERNFGQWMISESATKSMNFFQWANNGESIYFSKPGKDGFTYLSQFDLSSRNNIRMESEPYFVEDVKASPDKSSLLVIKSLLTQVPDFSQRTVFVITENDELIHLSSPELQEGEIINFSWFDSDNILITIFDSFNFSYTKLSYFHLPDQQLYEITSLHYDQLIRFNEQSVLLRKDDIEARSQLDIFSLDGLVQSLVINENCTHAEPSPLPFCQIIITCEQNSYSIDDDFLIKQLARVQGRLFFSPENQFIISYQENSVDGQQSFFRILNSDFSLIREITVDSTRQVVWQPNSHGFLFLTLEGLFYVSIPNGEPILVYKSNTDDYRHLDFVWFVP